MQTLRADTGLPDNELLEAVLDNPVILSGAPAGSVVWRQWGAAVEGRIRHADAEERAAIREALRVILLTIDEVSVR